MATTASRPSGRPSPSSLRRRSCRSCRSCPSPAVCSCPPPSPDRRSWRRRAPPACPPPKSAAPHSRPWCVSTQ
eukprot:3412004-Prymnesium_polylepis.1